MEIVTVNVCVEITQGNLVHVGDGLSHCFENRSLAVVLQENIIGVGEGQDGKHENENEVPDVLDHID
jgi:hypothetical protein